MNTHRLTPLQALTIADKGGQEHRDTDRGDTLAPVARSCWLSLSRSMMMNTAKEMNAHRDTGTPTDLHTYRLLPLPTQEDRDTGGRQARSLTGAYKKLF